MSTAERTDYLPGVILDSLPRGIVVTDLDWRIRYVNQPLAKALRCPAERLLGEHICLLDRKTEIRDSGHELLDFLVHLTKTPPNQLEVKTVQVQIPEKIVLRIQVQPYCPDGRKAGYVLSFVDWTRECGISEMKDRFISDASHELRTPMTSIKGSLELLLGGYAGELSDSATELLGICLTAVDRLIRLVNDLLDIAKIEAGEMELHRELLNVTDSINRSVRGITSLAQSHKVSIEVNSPATIPKVLADRDRLEQVITNLLSNALKYSPAESAVQINVQTGNGPVRVSVIDHGPGIPADQLNRVFDRFRQLEGAKKGTGLGLTICRALIEQHGGRIWVESESGQGARFHFELPTGPAQ
jgi:signal transduction histidine kinase